ncbi:uncharacterized protein LOC132720872 isoform X2 [Ruditapes philippinarum]|uniref:uncharacterized protein LOC132720872 isoform X2 n=1 Tax=Ruditapes philippinarum TaxID=129788 RepID=UPI00295BF337|nr:uncharacterized protein LOC132720872 isoform X2 [Ruditapes philippinarum]
MGTCLGKKKPKRNSVCPSPEYGNKSSRVTRKAPEDMIKDLEEANAEDSKLGTAGVSFTVDFQEGDPTRMPSRLADRLNGTVSPTTGSNEITYTAEEREIMAELLRDDILRERKEKAAALTGAKS